MKGILSITLLAFIRNRVGMISLLLVSDLIHADQKFIFHVALVAT
jgi:hypothetical protein